MQCNGIISPVFGPFFLGHWQTLVIGVLFLEASSSLRTDAITRPLGETFGWLSRDLAYLLRHKGKPCSYFSARGQWDGFPLYYSCGKKDYHYAERR
jgi:hypothetical protein